MSRGHCRTWAIGGFAGELVGSVNAFYAPVKYHGSSNEISACRIAVLGRRRQLAEARTSPIDEQQFFPTAHYNVAARAAGGARKAHQSGLRTRSWHSFRLLLTV